MGLSTAVNNGQNMMQVGEAAFTTTGATVTINTQFKSIACVQLTPKGTPAADENLSYSVSGGTITVTRTGSSKTSGLGFGIVVWGI